MFQFEAIGTHWQIDIFHNISNSNQNKLFAVIQNRIKQFEENYSRFLPHSLVSQMANRTGKYQLPLDAFHLLSFYHHLYILTKGKINPFMGKTLESTGYDKNYSLLPKKKIISPPKWDEAISISGQQIDIKTNFLFDFGAAGKGYLVDIIAQLLKDYTYSHFAIDAGGDILVNGHQSVTIGLENPFNTSEAIGQIVLQNQSIAASASNRRHWGKFHHILNPKNLQSAKNIVATWVIADTAMVADGLATALFFANPKQLANQFNFQYLIVEQDGSYHHSDEFSGQLF